MLVGAVAMAAAAFLPLVKSSGASGTISRNTPIQNGGWWLLAAALVVAASAPWLARSRSDAWLIPLAVCILASARIVVWAANTNDRVLYKVGADKRLDTSHPVVVPNGAALYVAAAGVLIAVTGSLMLGWTVRKARRLSSGTLQTGQVGRCPSCGKSAASDVKVCAHCGFAVRRYRRES